MGYCDQFVCLCVCLSVREHVSGTAGPIFTEYFVPVSYTHLTLPTNREV